MPGAAGRCHRCRVPAALTMPTRPATPWCCRRAGGFWEPLHRIGHPPAPVGHWRVPVAEELAAFGFRWFASSDPAPLSRWLDHRDPELLATNHAVSRSPFQSCRPTRTTESAARPTPPAVPTGNVCIHARSTPGANPAPHRAAATSTALCRGAQGTLPRRGYRATTMDDIAEAAGYVQPLVYQHFSSKRALSLELVDSIAPKICSLPCAAVSSSSQRDHRQQVEMGFAAYF